MLLPVAYRQTPAQTLKIMKYVDKTRAVYSAAGEQREPGNGHAQFFQSDSTGAPVNYFKSADQR